MSINAYRKTIANTESPRQIERRLLSEATSKLLEHIEYDTLQDGESKLAVLANGLSDAIHTNVRLWRALMYDLMEKENALPPQLRASLISLALWVERHSNGVLSGRQKIGPLIDINRSIARGLGGDSGQNGE